MKLLIDISEEEYKCVQITGHIGNVTQVSNAIFTGTRIPKGHGDLKDVSKIHLDKFVNCKNYSLHPLHSEDFKRGYNSAIDNVWNVLREAQTIVEADKEVEDAINTN